MAVSALAVAAVGAVLCAAFATQTVAGTLPAGVVRTTGGRLHDLGTGLILVGELVAALAATRLLPGAYRIEVVVLAVALLGIVPLLVALGIDAPGWGQRAVIAVGCVWQWRLTVRVRTGALSQDARRVGPGHGPGT
jgi:hypothetical protein